MATDSYGFPTDILRLWMAFEFRLIAPLEGARTTDMLSELRIAGKSRPIRCGILDVGMTDLFLRISYGYPTEILRNCSLLNNLLGYRLNCLLGGFLKWFIYIYIYIYIALFRGSAVAPSGESIFRNLTFWKAFLSPSCPFGESIFRNPTFWKVLLPPSCPFGGNPFSEISLFEKAMGTPKGTPGTWIKKIQVDLRWRCS